MDNLLLRLFYFYISGVCGAAIVLFMVAVGTFLGSLFDTDHFISGRISADLGSSMGFAAGFGAGIVSVWMLGIGGPTILFLAPLIVGILVYMQKKY